MVASKQTVGRATLSSHRWAIAAGMVLNSWAMTLPALSLGLLLPEIRDDFGLTLAQSGWLGASVRLGNILVALPAAFLLSRFRPSRVVIASLLVGMVLTLLHGFATGFIVFLLVRTAFGVSFSVRNPAQAMLIQQWFPIREVALVQGIIIGLMGIGEFAAVYGTPLILEVTGSWRAAYYVYGGFAAFAALYWISLGRERDVSAVISEQRAPLSTLLRYPMLWIVGLGAFCAAFNWMSFATFWPTFMLDENQISLKTSGFLFGILSLATVPASIGVGWLGSKIRGRRLLFATSGIAMAGGSIGLLYTTEFWLFLPLVVVVGIALGYIPLVLTLPFEIPHISQREIAVATSLITMLFIAGGIAGPITVGVISDVAGSARAALLIAALAPLGITLTSLFIPGRRTGSPT